MQHLVQGGDIIIHSSAFRISADTYPIETIQSRTAGNGILGRSKTTPYITPFGGPPQGPSPSHTPMSRSYDAYAMRNSAANGVGPWRSMREG